MILRRLSKQWLTKNQMHKIPQSLLTTQSDKKNDKMWKIWIKKWVKKVDDEMIQVLRLCLRNYLLFFFGLKYLKIISTCDISRKSWLTRTNPPSKSLMASARESMVSMSRWLVGSSSNNMCGFCQASQANITRHLCPSERFFIGTIWNFIMTSI